MSTTASIRALLTGLIDYAGLFPPAKLDMAATVRNYASYLAGEHSWMLARLIVPAARLDEFERAAGALLPGEGEPSWRLSALIGDDLEDDLDRIESFNARQDDKRRLALDVPVSGGAIVDAVELKAASLEQIEDAIELVPDELFPFVEIPAPGDPRGMIAALAGGELGAKIRTGGITADAFPASEQIARFITACHHGGVPLKATAGLHHPCRGDYRLTYEPDSPSGRMHGFLNVFVAACAARAGADAEEMTRLLEADTRTFRFGDDVAEALGRRIPLEVIEKARAGFALSFGSCSFEEPVEDLKALGLLSGGPTAGRVEEIGRA